VTTTPLAFQQLAVLLPGPPENAVIFILSYGLTHFETEIPDFAKATGMSEADLRELADEARLGSDPKAEKRDDQHLVSRALLRQFCTSTSNGPRMAHYSIQFGDRPDVSPQSVAKLDQFVKIDSKRTEEVWGKVETSLPAAIAAAEAGNLFSHPEHVATIKDAIALHYARSFDVKEHYESLWPVFLDAKRAQLRGDPGLLGHLHRLKTGSTTAPSDAEREEIVEEFVAGADNLQRSGIAFRYRVVYYFRTASALVANAGLELHRPPAGSEFLIGDVPVITTDASGHLRGIGGGVPIGSASLVAMPLSPTLLVALAQSDSDNVLQPAHVERLNIWQVEAAKRSVFMRQGSPLVGWPKTVRPPTGPVSSTPSS
jgi:hypothetical protein